MPPKNALTFLLLANSLELLLQRTRILDVCYYHVMYAFQSESTLYSCLNVKQLLARNRRDIWILSDSNEIRTHNHLNCKRALNSLAKVGGLYLDLSSSGITWNLLPSVPSIFLASEDSEEEVTMNKMKKMSVCDAFGSSKFMSFCRGRKFFCQRG